MSGLVQPNNIDLLIFQTPPIPSIAKFIKEVLVKKNLPHKRMHLFYTIRYVVLFFRVVLS